eukprot:364397-Chlamydomonas_euryale.AAC.29
MLRNDVLHAVPQSRVDNSDTLKALSQTMTAQLGKPETVSASLCVRRVPATCTHVTIMLYVRAQYVEIVLHCGVPMMFGGTEEPAAFCELICLGVIGGEKNKTVSAAVMGVLQQKLGVPPNRTYIRVSSMHRAGRSVQPAAVPLLEGHLQACISLIKTFLFACTQFNDPARSDFGWNMSTFG